MRIALYLAAASMLLTTLTTNAQASNCRVDEFDHNGSVMELQMCENTSADIVEISIVYVKPKAVLKPLKVQDGTLLFEGTIGANDKITGKARTFSRVCGEALFTVSGFERGKSLVLRGQAPKRDNNCKVIGSRAERLLFTLIDGSSSTDTNRSNDNSAPKFSDYRVAKFTGNSREPDLDSDPDAYSYRTRIRNAAKGKPNFAGEYFMATWGCGTTCVTGAAISARTGKVVFLPGSICCSDNEDRSPIEYKADSTLLALTGLINEQDPDGTHYYELKNGKFQFISRQTTSADLGQQADDSEGNDAQEDDSAQQTGRGNQQCTRLCEGREMLCGYRLKRLGDAQGWDGDLRQGYAEDTCDPEFKQCRANCNS